MSRTKKNKNKPGNQYGIKRRKMKPYCLTGDKKNVPDLSDSNTSFEKYENIGQAKKEREDRKIMRKAEVHKVRQQAKNKLRKDLDELNDL